MAAAAATAGEGLLTVGNVADYTAKTLSSCKASPICEDVSRLRAREISGGNLNFAFAVEDDNGGAVFVKQAPDFIKVIPDHKLERERMILEYAFYDELQEVLGQSLAAKHLPVVHAFDEERMVMIMEFLGSYELLQSRLFIGSADREIAAALGEVMGVMHGKTHCSLLDPAEVERLSKKYENSTLRGIQLEFVFSKCFREDARAAHLREDAGFMAKLEALKAAYRGDDKTDLALLHGDLHAGSVMADEHAGAVKLIDPEFAIYGPPGLDLGSLLSTYALAYCYRIATTGSVSAAEPLLTAAERLVESYAAASGRAGVAAAVVAQAAELALGFAGCEIARTALGMAYERSMRIDDEAVKAEAEKRVLEVGARCIRAERGEGPEVLMAELRRFAADREVFIR